MERYELPLSKIFLAKKLDINDENLWFVRTGTHANLFWNVVLYIKDQCGVP